MLFREKKFLCSGRVFRRHWSAMESFVQFVAEPQQLMLASVFRAVVAIHHRFSESWTTVLGMLGATFVGFVVQFMYRGPPRPHRRVIDHIEQDYFEEPQPTCIPESEAQSVSYSEILLSPIATQQFSAGHELVLPTSNLPKLPDNAERVVQTDTFVSSRHVPNDVHRPEASRSQRCIPVVTSYNDNVLATSSN